MTRLAKATTLNAIHEKLVRLVEKQTGKTASADDVDEIARLQNAWFEVRNLKCVEDP